MQGDFQVVHVQLPVPLSLRAMRFLHSSCVTSGAFEFVCGEIFGHIMVFSSPTG